MQKITNSQGISFIGFLCGLGVVLMVVLLAFRIAPAYIENYSINDSLRSLQAKLDEQTQTDIDRIVISKTLEKMFDVNSIRAISAKDAEIIPQKEGGYLVRTVYNVNVDLVGNLSLQIHFDNSVVVKSHAT